MSKALPAEQAKEAAEDLSKFVEVATKPKPNKKWYSVSIDGLIKAVDNLGITTIRGVQINRCAGYFIRQPLSVQGGLGLFFKKHTGSI